jgi:hypothetical protein
MKTAMAQKPPETALWPRRIFSARMSAETAGRKIAMAFRRFAKGFGLPSAAQLALCSIRLRFKRCDMPLATRHSPLNLLRKFHRTERTAPGTVF